MNNTAVQLEIIKNKDKIDNELNKYYQVLEKVDKLEVELAIKLKNNYDFLIMLKNTYNESMNNYYEITKNLL